jgi:hypothetical protein
LSPRKVQGLQGPQMFKPRVRDTSIIHNQAYLRPTIRQRGITPVLSTGANAAVLPTKQGMQLYSYWNGQNGSPQTVSFWSGTTVLFQYLYNFQVSQFGFFALMYPAASTLTVTKSQASYSWSNSLAANCLPLSIHSSQRLLGDTSRKSSRH